MRKVIIFTIMAAMFLSSCSFRTHTYPKELALAKETGHAKIYVRQTDQDINDMVEIIASEFENQYSRLTDLLQVSPSNKTIIHIYTDKEQFRQMIGRDTEGTYDARDQIIKVYTPHDLSIIQVRDEYTFQVIHEYVHAIIQQINSKVGKVKWLDEGTAYYASEQLEAEIIKGRYSHISVPDIKDFFDSQSYFDKTGGEAYYFSGLMVQFIYEKYGEDKFNQIIRDPEDMEKILELSLEDLYMEWTEYVNTLYQ